MVIVVISDLKSKELMVRQKYIYADLKRKGEAFYRRYRIKTKKPIF
jgi:hypothetical protein